MTSSLSQILKRTFDLASLRREAEKTLNAKEWKEYGKIKEQYAGRKSFEQRAFELEYKTRVEIARKRLINRAGEKNRDFKHRWLGADRFDEAAITRQARREIQRQHDKLLAHLQNQEIQDMNAFLDRCAHRRSKREKPKRDFERATDRRKGVERRRAIPRRRSR